MKRLLAQLRLMFDAPAPAPLAPEPVHVHSAGPGPGLGRDASSSSAPVHVHSAGPGPGLGRDASPSSAPVHRHSAGPRPGLGRDASSSSAPVHRHSAGPRPGLGLDATSAILMPLPPRLVRHPRARQYVLRLLPDGTPRVTIPRWGSKREALAFLQAQQDWVARQRAAQVTRASLRPSRDWRDGHEVLLGGCAVPLRRGAAARAGVVEQGGALVVTPRPRDGDDLRPVASAWLIARATRVLPPRLMALAAQFDLAITQVSVRNQRARWGSCATGGRISLNWRLIQTPDAVRDYVLIHELMHLRQPNHSARFWTLVARACPGHEASRRWLRAHEAALLDAR